MVHTPAQAQRSIARTMLYPEPQDSIECGLLTDGSETRLRVESVCRTEVRYSQCQVRSIRIHRPAAVDRWHAVPDRDTSTVGSWSRDRYFGSEPTTIYVAIHHWQLLTPGRNCHW